MSTNSVSSPHAVLGLRKVALALAALSWAAVIAALFVAWLAAPGRGSERRSCEPLGRAGERCPEAARAPVAEPPCANFGRGGSLCPAKP